MNKIGFIAFLLVFKVSALFAQDRNESDFSLYRHYKNAEDKLLYFMSRGENRSKMYLSDPGSELDEVEFIYFRHLLKRISQITRVGRNTHTRLLLLEVETGLSTTILEKRTQSAYKQLDLLRQLPYFSEEVERRIGNYRRAIRNR